MTTDTERSPILYPVILSGGTGTRLWPVSRALYPKQLRALVSQSSMLQDTALRLVPVEGVAPPLVVCNEEHRFIVAEQLRELDLTPLALLLEPEGRNTAPAAAVAALWLLDRDPEAVMAVLPADHAIADVAALRLAVGAAAALARGGALVALGGAPSAPETGYGYVKLGPNIGGHPGCHTVERFVEKPDPKTAAAFVESGEYLWNLGIFTFRADRIVEELEKLRPDIVECCRAAVDEGAGDLDFYRLGSDAFLGCPSASIDYAVMEPTRDAAVVPVDMGWSDIGSWSALWDIGAKDDDGNVLIGDVVARDTHGCYIRGERALIATAGLSDTVVVETGDAVLVAARDGSQEIRELVAELVASGRTEQIAHRRTYRPWGYFEAIDAGARFRVKHLVVKPGAALSLQSHRHRAEHWVVVSGTAKVTRGGKVVMLRENESTYIPIGTRHRLENAGEVPLDIIEVQSGDYLGEDDIVRFDDRYGRHEGDK